MNLKEAALELHERISPEKWFVAVGVGKDEIIAYVTSKERAVGVVPKYVHGFKVNIKEMGQPIAGPAE